MPDLNAQITEDRGDKDFREWLTEERAATMASAVKQGMLREVLDCAYAAGRESGIVEMQELITGTLREPINADAKAPRS